MTLEVIIPVEDYVAFSKDGLLSEQALAWVEDITERVNLLTDRPKPGTLTDGANIAWDAEAIQFASVTLGGDRVLDNPTNLVAGQRYYLLVTQDGAGTRLLTYGSAFLWPGGTAPTLTTAAGAVDLLEFISDGTSLYGDSKLNFS